jgi:ferritin-like metal-binding protein YciE
MPTGTLHDVFLDEMRDIYNAEKQLVRALPKMARAATDETLKQAFQSHLEETKGQVDRLDQAFEMLDARSRSRGVKCEAMEGMIAEAQELMEKELDENAMDAALVGAAQKVEHYEIASYGTICAMAKAMGHNEVANLLAETLEEEKATDEKLTMIGEPINRLAAAEAHPEMDEESEGGRTKTGRRSSSRGRMAAE